jgi:hypothetical protein
MSHKSVENWEAIAVSATIPASKTSEIERWAFSFWLNSHSGKNMVIALSGYSAYFDASMNKPLDEMVVAGYLSTVEEWAQFEISWKLVLAKHDVPFFKMSEFIGRRKEYSHPKWTSESYRAQFISDLALIIRSWTVASIAGRMKKELFERYNSMYELDARFNLFALCARDCAAQARKYVRSIPSDLPIAFIFDRGDDGSGLLTEEMKSSGLPTPVFKRSRPDPELDKDDPYHVQLQACDLAAWELRRGESDLEEGKLPEELRKSLLALNHTNKIWKQALEPDLQGLIQVAGIKRRPEKLSETPPRPI